MKNEEYCKGSLYPCLKSNLATELTSWHLRPLADPAEPRAATADSVVVPADEDEVALHVAGHAPEGGAVHSGGEDGDDEGEEVTGHHFDQCFLGLPENFSQNFYSMWC